jgi:hypothetical protein
MVRSGKVRMKHGNVTWWWWWWRWWQHNERTVNIEVANAIQEYRGVQRRDEVLTAASNNGWQAERVGRGERWERQRKMRGTIDATKEVKVTGLAKRKRRKAGQAKEVKGKAQQKTQRLEW